MTFARARVLDVLFDRLLADEALLAEETRLAALEPATGYEAAGPDRIYCAYCGDFIAYEGETGSTDKYCSVQCGTDDNADATQ